MAASDHKKYLFGKSRMIRCQLRRDLGMHATPNGPFTPDTSARNSFDTPRIPHQDRLQHALHEAADTWERDAVSDAAAITDRRASLIYPRPFSQPRLDKSAAVAIVAREYHLSSGKIGADFFALHAWLGLYPPAPIRQTPPNAVALSATVTIYPDSIWQHALRLDEEVQITNSNERALNRLAADRTNARPDQQSRKGSRHSRDEGDGRSMSERNRTPAEIRISNV